MIEAYMRSVLAVVRAVEWVDSATCRLPVWSRARGAALDSLFGPEEDIEYVSTTTPAGPPPTY